MPFIVKIGSVPKILPTCNINMLISPLKLKNIFSSPGLMPVIVHE